MTISGVNNSNNNAGAYAATAALLGGATGAVAGYATKNILKDGQYTDEFVSQTTKEFMNSPTGKAIKDIVSIDLNSSKLSEEVYDVCVKHAKTLGLDMKGASREVAQLIDTNETKTILESLKSGIAEKYGDNLKFGKDTNIVEIVKTHVPEDLDAVFDRSKNAFREGLVDDNVLKLAKKSMRNLKLKTAGIYGGIAAAVLGLGTYLCCAGKKAPEQKVDA